MKYTLEQATQKVIDTINLLQDAESASIDKYMQKYACFRELNGTTDYDKYYDTITYALFGSICEDKDDKESKNIVNDDGNYLDREYINVTPYEFYNACYEACLKQNVDLITFGIDWNSFSDGKLVEYKDADNFIYKHTKYNTFVRFQWQIVINMEWKDNVGKIFMVNKVFNKESEEQEMNETKTTFAHVPETEEESSKTKVVYNTDKEKKPCAVEELHGFSFQWDDDDSKPCCGTAIVLKREILDKCRVLMKSKNDFITVLYDPIDIKYIIRARDLPFGSLFYAGMNVAVKMLLIQTIEQWGLKALVVKRSNYYKALLKYTGGCELKIFEAFGLTKRRAVELALYRLLQNLVAGFDIDRQEKKKVFEVRYTDQYGVYSLLEIESESLDTLGQSIMDHINILYGVDSETDGVSVWAYDEYGEQVTYMNNMQVSEGEDDGEEDDKEIDDDHE